MSTESLDRQQVRHPYRGRAPRGPDLSTFAAMVRNHDFLFEKARMASDAPHDFLGSYVPLMAREMEILQMAWEGGDDFVRVLSSHLERRRSALVPQKTRDDDAAEAIIATVSDAEREYAVQLAHFDWWHYMADDGGTLRKGGDREDALKKIATEKGGMFQRLFDFFIEKRNAALRSHK